MGSSPTPLSALKLREGIAYGLRAGDDLISAIGVAISLLAESSASGFPSMAINKASDTLPPECNLSISAACGGSG